MQPRSASIAGPSDRCACRAPFAPGEAGCHPWPCALLGRLEGRYKYKSGSGFFGRSSALRGPRRAPEAPGMDPKVCPDLGVKCMVGTPGYHPRATQTEVCALHEISGQNVAVLPNRSTEGRTAIKRAPGMGSVSPTTRCCLKMGYGRHQHVPAPTNVNDDCGS